MAFFGEHVQFTIMGNLPGGEVWNCNIRSDITPPAISNAELSTAAQAVATRFASVITAPASMVGGDVSLNEVTARLISAAGVTLDQATKAPLAATVGASLVARPNQCAVVVTLLTASPTRKGRGRIFLPVLGGSMINARMGTSQRDSIADTMKTFLDGANADLGAAIGVGFAIQSQVAPLTAASANLITGLRVGDVVDTQRSRRSGLGEVFAVRTLAP